MYRNVLDLPRLALALGKVSEADEEPVWPVAGVPTSVSATGARTNHEPRWALLLAAGCWRPPGRSRSGPARTLSRCAAQKQDVYWYAAQGGRGKGTVLFAPGDGGWRGFGVSDGGDHRRLGLRRLRHRYQAVPGEFHDQPRDVKGGGRAGRLRAIAAQAARGPSDKVILAGWSEGAGLMLLAAAARTSSGIGGWWPLVCRRVRYWDGGGPTTSPTSPSRSRTSRISTSLPYLPKVAPLPFAAIDSSRDEYTPTEAAREDVRRGGRAQEARVVDAQNHKFNGNRDGFFRALREALEWIGAAAD